MTPSQLAKRDSEHAHQVALFAWCAIAHLHGFDVADRFDLEGQTAFKGSSKTGIRGLKWIHAIPNGGARGDDATTRTIRGGQLKAEGVRSGVADVFLPWPSAGMMGLYIEMKKPSVKPVKETSKGGMSDEQIEFAKDVKSAGYGCITCYSWREAADIIKAYFDWNRS